MSEDHNAASDLKTPQRDDGTTGTVAGPLPPELLALLRVLLKEPPREHDFSACPICKRYGITSI